MDENIYVPSGEECVGIRTVQLELGLGAGYKCK